MNRLKEAKPELLMNTSELFYRSLHFNELASTNKYIIIITVPVLHYIMHSGITTIYLLLLQYF